MNILVSTLTFATTTFAEASWRFEISEKQDVGQHRNSLNSLKIVVQIWNATAGGAVCRLSTSHSRNGAFTTAGEYHWKIFGASTFVLPDNVSTKETI